MSDCEDWADALAEAKATRHAVLTGARVIMTRIGEKEVRKSEIKMPELERYIGELQRKVDRCNGLLPARRAILNIIPVDSNS